VLFFCSMAVQLQVLGPADRFTQLLLMGSPIAISESFVRFLSALIWATIPWGVLLWVRWRRQRREEKRRQEDLNP